MRRSSVAGHCVLCAIGVSAPALAQAGHAGGDHVGIVDGVAWIDTAQTRLAESGDGWVRLAPIDAASLAEAEGRAQQAGRPTRFAIPGEVSLSPRAHGSVAALPGDRIEWTLDIEAPGALSVNLGTRLPALDSVTLYLVDANGNLVGEPYSGADAIDGQLWTRLAPGSFVQLVVEAPTAAWADFAAGFEVFRVNTGFLDITGVGGDEGLGLRTAACQVDVACPVAAPFGSPISSVGRITVAGVSVCGGVLLNNTRGDQTPYFLTAYHCDAWTNPAATVVYWNYENTTCRTPGSAGGNGDGPLTQSTSGAVLRANAPQGDATLLELASAPDAEWGVDFAGWDATGDANDPVSYAVHHPNGKEKRIALEYDFLSKTTISLIGQSGIRTWRTQFEEGGIELGSSGGALFSRAGRVIGVTTGVDTLTACYPQRAYFGRVDHAWDVGSSASGRLRDWLDPDNTGARTLDPLLGGGTAPGDFALMTPFNGDQAVALNGTFTWTPAEEAAAYRIEIDDDGDFSAGLVIKADVSEAYWQTPSGLLSEDTAYWWRVTALNSYDETPAIATYSFTTMRDCNGNLTHDPYEIAQGYATDCDENGRPDECDLATESVFYASQTLGPVGGNGPQLVDGMVDARTAASDVTIRFVTRADISTSSETIEVFVNGVNAGVLYAFTTSDCAAGGTVDTIVLEADDWNAMVEAGDGSAILSMEPSSYVNAGSCGGDSTLAFTIDYTAQPTLTDADGDGLPDGCSIACSAADVTTESSTNGRPDGRITLDDFAYFISQWASDDPAVDLTVATDCQPGTGGDGVTLSDFTCFLAIWSEGCGDPREDGHSGGIADDVVIGATLPAN